LGRFGTALALELARRGTDVLAIDNRPAIVQRLAGSLARVVAVDSTDIDALQEVGVGEFGRAVVAIGVDQQSSILTTSLLSDLRGW
jgi:trk system potassium uptake protein TrkA